MKGGAKGQSKIAVTVIALVLALPLSQIPQAAIASFISSSINGMELNHARYKSMAHSYKFISDDVNNRVEYSEVKTGLSSLGEGCTSSLYQPEDYNVTFASVDAGTTYSSKGCTGTAGEMYELLRTPALPFYEVKTGDRVGVSTYTGIWERVLFG